MYAKVQLKNVFRVFELALEYKLTLEDMHVYNQLYTSFGFDEYNKKLETYNEQLAEFNARNRKEKPEHPGKGPNLELYEAKYEFFKSNLDPLWHNVHLHEGPVSVEELLEAVLKDERILETVKKVYKQLDADGVPKGAELQFAAGKVLVHRIDQVTKLPILLGPHDLVKNGDSLTMQFIR